MSDNNNMPSAFDHINIEGEINIDMLQIFIGDHFDSCQPTISDYCFKNDLILRVWYPNTRGTMDARNDRINVSVSAEGIVTEISIG